MRHIISTGALTLLMGAASVDFVDKRLTGMTSGLMNAAQYAGAGLAAATVARVVDVWGWHVFALALLPGALLSSGAMFHLMGHKSEQSE